MAEAAPFDFISPRPAPPLSAFIESIWAVRGSAGYRRFTMLPNGAVQLMVNFGTAHTVLEAGGRRVGRALRSAWIAGLQEKPLKIESPPETDLLSIRFRPGGAHAFLRLPLQPLTGDVVDAEDVFGPDVRTLRERLGHAPTRQAQWAVAECWLLGRLRPRESKYGLLTRALYSLAQGQRGSVRSTCADLGLGNERMIRVFRRLAGLPPKALARVQRFHGALAPLAGGREPLVDLALRLGLYDQAHFNHEFFRLAGVAPGEFVRRRGEDEESLIDD